MNAWVKGYHDHRYNTVGVLKYQISCVDFCSNISLTYYIT